MEGVSGDAEAWAQLMAASLAESSGGRIVDSGPVTQAGLAGWEYEIAVGSRIARARLLAAGPQRYELSASAPTWGANQQYFLDFLTLVRDQTPPAAPP
jgi:hypothetical protein